MRSESQVNRRSFLGATAAATLAGLAGCSTARRSSETPASNGGSRWPDPKPSQREVMLLGTIHLAQSPENTQNAYAVDPGNVLGQQRQRELETLTDRLAAWEPDQIAVEHVASEQSRLNEVFSAYIDETRDVTAVPGWERERSDEIVQIGFRLAEKLDHDSLAAVDYFQSPAALLTEEERARLPNSLTEFIVDPDSVDYPLPDPATYIQQQQQRLDEEPLVDFYEYLNQPDVGAPAWHNDQLFYASAFEQCSPGEYTAVKILTAWTQRNLRIVSNIWNMPETDGERVLVVFGASHVPQLGQMLTGAPMMAPVSPLPYLAADERGSSSIDA